MGGGAPRELVMTMPDPAKSRETERFALVPIFQGLGQAEIARILKITEERTYEAGSYVFRPGDAVEGFYVILEGKIEIRSPKTEAGAEIPLATLSNRSVFGEMALLANRARASAAVAIDRTRVMVVPKKDFDAMLAAGDVSAYKIVHAFAKIIGQRLRRTEDELIGLVREMGFDKQQKKLAELQQFRQKLFSEWSF